MNPDKPSVRLLPGLVVGALGVVYGDIGTSPLYALRECFHGSNALLPTQANVLGVLSLIFWSLVTIVSVKYVWLVLRADNKGEGGILALLALAVPEARTGGSRRLGLVLFGLFGAALLYGDGVITPAVTVLSAVEGLDVATPVFGPFLIPIAVAILAALFSVQRHGTGKVGSAFGPVMAVWFVTIAWLGLRGLLRAPEVLAAVDPRHGLAFLWHNGWTGFVVLGAVFLVLTGAEALYADMGHFGARPIRIAWFALVLPSLFLNYLGQGALLLGNPEAATNPFYLLAPRAARYPLVCLATLAAIIASQALISGVFSLTMQSVQMGFLPRMEIRHTSSAQRGQIYVPQINTMLMLACIALVVGFGSSTKLAAAYGIAVTLTMIITTVIFYCAARRLWGWSERRAGLLAAVFLTIEASFCASNLVKIAHGGWVPLVIGTVLSVVMCTWRTGRRLLWEQLSATSLPLDLFLDDLVRSPVVRVPGTAVFLSGTVGVTPLALLHNLKHNRVLHERNILLTVSTREVPHIDPPERVRVEELRQGFYRVTAEYGFMEEPDVQGVLSACAAQGLAFEPAETSFFLSSETILPGSRPTMARWRKRLFAILSRNAQRATAFFRLPANRVVELGMQVEL